MRLCRRDCVNSKHQKERQRNNILNGRSNRLDHPASPILRLPEGLKPLHRLSHKLTRTLLTADILPTTRKYIFCPRARSELDGTTETVHAPAFWAIGRKTAAERPEIRMGPNIFRGNDGFVFGARNPDVQQVSMPDEGGCARRRKQLWDGILEAEVLHQHTVGEIKPKAVGEGGDQTRGGEGKGFIGIHPVIHRLDRIHMGKKCNLLAGGTK